MLSTSIEILPTGAIFSKVTLERLLIPLALALLVAGGARLRHFRTGLDIPIALLLAAAAATTIRNGYPAAPLRFLVTAVGWVCASSLAVKAWAWGSIGGKVS